MLPLMYLRRRYADALVAVFPSNCGTADDRVLMAHAETAFRHVERLPDTIVFVGDLPDGPARNYGYILPGSSIIGGDGLLEVKRVSRFIESPARRTAAELIQLGALWNTGILVFRLGAVLDLMWRTAPILPLAFTEIAEAIDKQRVARQDATHGGTGRLP